MVKVPGTGLSGGGVGIARPGSHSYNGYQYQIAMIGRNAVYVVTTVDGNLLEQGQIVDGTLAAAEQAARDFIDQYDPSTPSTPYPHMMYDCKTGKGYRAFNEAMHTAFANKGYVHDLSECEIVGGEVVGGGDGDNGILETAGTFVVGVAKGTLIATVPIVSMAVAVGFMRRIVRFGVGVGS